MKTRFLAKTVFALIAAGAIGTAAAQGVQKLGYVNAERVYSESRTAQRIETELQAEFSKAQQKLNRLQESGIKLQQKLAEGKLKGDAQHKAEEQLLDISRQYRIAAAELAEDYNLRRNEEFAALQHNANEIIHHLAKSEGYDLIVQEAVFVSGKYDITDRVIKLLDGQK